MNSLFIIKKREESPDWSDEKAFYTLEITLKTTKINLEF